MTMIQLWPIFLLIGITVQQKKTDDNVIKHGACPYNSIMIKNTCYWITKPLAAHPDAANECKKHGGRLAILKTQTLVDSVMKVKSNVANGEAFWIGMNDLGQKSDWRYVDGTKVIEKEMWFKDEPNGVGPTCGAIQKRKCDALLFDGDCTTHMRGACEIVVNSTAATVCPTDSILYRGVCYWLTKHAVYQETREECKKLGGRLAIVKNKLKALTVMALAADHNALWVGMNDLHQKSDWKHLDGTPVTQQEIKEIWLENEPNGAGSTCGAVMYTDKQFKFYDDDCSHPMPAVSGSQIKENQKKYHTRGNCFDAVPFSEGNAITCLWMIKKQVTYEEAEQICNGQRKSKLAMPKTIQKLEAIKKLLPPNMPSRIWLGMSDRESEDNWKYADGTPVTGEHISSMWLKDEAAIPKEPNGGREENCGVMFNDYHYKLGDEKCHNHFLAVCEFHGQ